VQCSNFAKGKGRRKLGLLPEKREKEKKEKEKRGQERENEQRKEEGAGSVVVWWSMGYPGLKAGILSILQCVQFNFPDVVENIVRFVGEFAHELRRGDAG